METDIVKIKASHVYANTNNIISCSLEGDVITIVTPGRCIEYTIDKHQQTNNATSLYSLIVKAIQESIVK